MSIIIQKRNGKGLSNVNARFWKRIFPVKVGDKVKVTNPDRDNKQLKDAMGIVTFVYPELFTPCGKYGSNFIVVHLLDIPTFAYKQRRTFRQKEVTRIGY